LDPYECNKGLVCGNGVCIDQRRKKLSKKICKKECARCLEGKDLIKSTVWAVAQNCLKHWVGANKLENYLKEKIYGGNSILKAHNDWAGIGQMVSELCEEYK